MSHMSIEFERRRRPGRRIWHDYDITFTTKDEVRPRETSYPEITPMYQSVSHTLSGPFCTIPCDSKELEDDFGRNERVQRLFLRLILSFRSLAMSSPSPPSSWRSDHTELAMSKTSEVDITPTTIRVVLSAVW